MLDDPLLHAIVLILQMESHTSRLVQDLVARNTDDVYPFDNVPDMCNQEKKVKYVFHTSFHISVQ